MNILLADDEPAMLKIVATYFLQEDFAIFTAADGEEALAIFEQRHIDLAILDWMMPKLDGLALCREIKAFSPKTKVIMLTAKSQEDDEIMGLASGADDYLKKPYSPRVLLLRAKKLLNYQDSGLFGGMKIDRLAKKVYQGDRNLGLTKIEFELLDTLVRNEGLILSRGQLLDLVWGVDYEGDERTVDTHIRRLRAKIGERQIKTHRGLGYSLEVGQD